MPGAVDAGAAATAIGHCATLSDNAGIRSKGPSPDDPLAASRVAPGWLARSCCSRRASVAAQIPSPTAPPRRRRPQPGRHLAAPDHRPRRRSHRVRPRSAAVPDGTWVTYGVSTVDVAKDKSDNDVWMVKWDGSERLRLTSTGESESAAKWSPDGKWISFLRQDEKKKAQVWTLSRLGGEAQKLTDVAWRRLRLRLVARQHAAGRDVARRRSGRGRGQARSRAEADRDRDVQVQARRRRLRRRQAPHALVSLRHRAARHDAADLGGIRRHRADVVARRQAHRLPQRAIGDAREVAVREVYVVEARAGATPRQVSTKVARHGEPLAWSPDGTKLLYMEGGDPRFDAYEQYHMAVVPVAGGAATLLTPTLDRPVSDAVWSKDGSRVTFVVSDDREVYVASVPAAGGTVTRITKGAAGGARPCRQPCRRQLRGDGEHADAARGDLCPRQRRAAQADRPQRLDGEGVDARHA